MSRYLTLLSILILSIEANAQLPDGSVAPDFTGTDLNGNVHHLYDYLDQGYTVILDFSATWCGPCWDYHNEHHLENLYLQYGPGTAEDRVMVLFIESDEDTPTENLYGAGWSAGDWVTGTEHPIIDDHLIGELFEINGYPYIYKVCPDRIATDIGTIPLEALWAEVQECPHATLPNDAFMKPTVRTQAACVNNGTLLNVMLQNNGTEPLTSATIEAYLDGNLIGSTNWTGDLPTYISEEVTVGSFTPEAPGTLEINYQITSPDGDPTNNSITTEIIVDDVVTSTEMLMLEVRTDAFPFETNWKVFDESGTVVAENPVPYNVQHNVFTHTLELEPGICYVFEIYDNYGDGICCLTGEGYYKLIAAGEVLFEGGDFEEQAAHPFLTSLNVSVAGTGSLQGTAIHPNPGNGLFKITIPGVAMSPAEIRVIDMHGAQVPTPVLPEQINGTIDLDLTHLSEGVYFLQLGSGSERATHKIVIMH